eukprot:1067665-Rhodomonas_salina.1
MRQDDKDGRWCEGRQGKWRDGRTTKCRQRRKEQTHTPFSLSNLTRARTCTYICTCSYTHREGGREENLKTSNADVELSFDCFVAIVLLLQLSFMLRLLLRKAKKCTKSGFAKSRAEPESKIW